MYEISILMTGLCCDSDLRAPQRRAEPGNGVIFWALFRQFSTPSTHLVKRAEKKHFLNTHAIYSCYNSCTCTASVHYSYLLTKYLHRLHIHTHLLSKWETLRVTMQRKAVSISLIVVCFCVPLSLSTSHSTTSLSSVTENLLIRYLLHTVSFYRSDISCHPPLLNSLFF